METVSGKQNLYGLPLLLGILIKHPRATAVVAFLLIPHQTLQLWSEKGRCIVKKEEVLLRKLVQSCKYLDLACPLSAASFLFNFSTSASEKNALKYFICYELFFRNNFTIFKVLLTECHGLRQVLSTILFLPFFSSVFFISSFPQSCLRSLLFSSPSFTNIISGFNPFCFHFVKVFVFPELQKSAFSLRSIADQINPNSIRQR